ncbi:putative cell wall protein o-glucosyl hydrolase [Venturia nashicola]|nr:putative cell wall protein o-glucosyl hydrolase [Venturia nashicola]
MSPPHATTVRFDGLPTPSTEIKRGISVPWNFDPKHFAIYKAAIDSGKIGWVFNWEMWKPLGLPPTVTYIPQCRTVKEVDQVIPRITIYQSDDQTLHFIGFNEPCIDTQASVSISEAVELWKEHILPLRYLFPSVQIGSPAIANGPHGLPWIISFISDLGGIQASGIDHIVVHVYDTTFQGFREYVEEVYDAFGLPIWVTEFACATRDPKERVREEEVSEEQVLKFMRECVEFLEQAKYVERYAWYGAMDDVGNGVGRANGLQRGDQLTKAGKLYVSL